jgi:hypothetical protein
MEEKGEESPNQSLIRAAIRISIQAASECQSKEDIIEYVNQAFYT